VIPFIMTLPGIVKPDHCRVPARRHLEWVAATMSRRKELVTTFCRRCNKRLSCAPQLPV
jgi:hypothetical protein